jgi:uncharacterized tellurite resistance protein B-like protein
MFESFKKLIAELGEGSKHPSRFDDSDYRLAAAALLVHAAGIDGSISRSSSALVSTMPRPMSW